MQSFWRSELKVTIHPNITKLYNIINLNTIFLVMIFTVFQIREGSRVKNPRKLATWPDKINGKLEKAWGNPHLLARQNSLLAPCLWKLSGTLIYLSIGLILQLNPIPRSTSKWPITSHRMCTRRTNVALPFFSRSSTASWLVTVPFSALAEGSPWSWASPMAPCEMGGSLMVLQVNPPSSFRGIFSVKRLTTTIMKPLTPKMIIAAKRKETAIRDSCSSMNFVLAAASLVWFLVGICFTWGGGLQKFFWQSQFLPQSSKILKDLRNSCHDLQRF